MKFTGRIEAEGGAIAASPEDAEREAARIRAGVAATRARREGDADRGPYDLRAHARIAEVVLRRLDSSAIPDLPRVTMVAELIELVRKIADEQRIDINEREQDAIATSIADDLTGYGPLEALLDNDAVTEIMVNGPKTIYIEKEGNTFRSEVRFRDEAHLRTVASRIARFVGRRLDEQQPYVDARLPDGSRVNIVIPPVALDGTSISIRKFPRGKLTLRDLQRFGGLSGEMARFIECISAARCNVLVSGGTSSGKTTILNALGDFIRPTERVVTIEDSAELRLDIGNLVRLETKHATAEAGSRAVTQRDLVANALRMRPDRIILGEVRREEAFDLLSAMNTGHDGSMGTLHSNSPRDTCSRLENMILMGGVDLPIRVLRAQIASAVDFIVHAARGADGKRRITHITEVVGMEGETIALQDVFLYETADGKRFGAGEFVANAVNLRAGPKLKAYGHYDRAMEAVLTAPRASAD